MKKIIINDYHDIPTIDKNVSCIGYFDCLHIGHQKLIKETILKANKLNVKSCLICFNPDPKDVILKSKNKNLLTYSNRLKLIEELKIDIVIIIKFNEEIMKLKYTDFIKKYLNKFNIVELICGFDFRFGYNALGNANDLIDNAKFKTCVIDAVLYRNKKVSSTYIKELLYKGNFRLVNRLLAYDYYLDLKVKKVSKNKDKWLIELVLVNNKLMLPSDNVYKYFIVKDNKVYIETNEKLELNSNYKLYLYE